MDEMAQRFAASWPWLALAGAWSLGCGWWLRRAWTAAADAALAHELKAARHDAQQWKNDAGSARYLLQSLEADLIEQRHRVADVEAASAAELQMLTLKLASHEAKAAAELASARRDWDVERSTLVDELGLRLAAQEREHAHALESAETESATLAAEIMQLTHVQLRADDLLSQLEASQAALRVKQDALSALEGRLLLMAPLPGRVALAERELALLRHRLADRDAALTRLWVEASGSSPALGRHEELKPVSR